jgi:hypothetical protein
MKVPRHCLLVLVVKVDLRGGIPFGPEEGRDKRRSRERSELHLNNI